MSNARRVTLAGTSLFAEAAYSDAAAELEAVAVAFEVLEVPAVEAVAPGVGVLDGDGGFKFPK